MRTTRVTNKHVDHEHADAERGPMPSVIPAAGTVPWRRGPDGSLEVLLVHRPRYHDWSWAKGKLDPGEEFPVAAARETEEETSIPVRLGRPLPPAEYTLLDNKGRPATKEVRYWAATPIGPGGDLVNEIDEIAWLSVPQAHERLDYARDRDQLRALVRMDQEGELETTPFIIVRHAKALSRSSFQGPDDQQRPLEPSGQERARAIVPLLTAYDIRRVSSSPSVRCVDTLRPYADHIGRPVKNLSALSEEDFALDPVAAAEVTRNQLGKRRPRVLSGHGPVLPVMLHVLSSRCSTSESGRAAQVLLDSAIDHGMAKGEAIIAHVSRSPVLGPLVVAVERSLPAAAEGDLDG
ncbi:MAG: NUDIX hydrolase [Actinomycetia bacterium]|nr:NUDIX hydrolase [Actinomycetes bacterium]